MTSLHICSRMVMMMMMIIMIMALMNDDKELELIQS